MTMMHDTTHRQATEAAGLRDQIQAVVANLPPIEYHPRANGEIDYYGASFCIARSLGLEKPLFGRATWMHGWMWFDVTSTAMIVNAEYRDRNNLVVSPYHETYLKSHGFKRAVAVGATFLYAEQEPVERIPDSILVFPVHTTQCANHSIDRDIPPYIEYARGLQKRFSLVAFSLGYEDVRRGNWVRELEQAGIPWISGAWTHDKNALTRMHRLLGQFEYATSNAPGSHFAYAAYCGCKMSFDGPSSTLLMNELDSHPHYIRYPDLAHSLKKRDLFAEFRSKFPFFFVEPRQASTQVAWARQALGEGSKKRPEEIADLFEWKLRRLAPGRWTPVDKNDALTSEELFAKATARSIVGRHKEAFALTDVLKRRQARFKDMETIRSAYFLSVNDTPAAREALGQELRNFPDNVQAAAMLRKLDGDVPARAAPPRDEAFLDPRPSPGFADLYLVRKGILERLNQAIPLFSGTLLDVGCGQMPYRDHILAHNPKITRYVGLDFATGKYADRKKPDLTWDGLSIPLPDGGADCAMATEVLEHCPDPLPVLTEIRRVLAPGGCLFFTVPFLWPIHDAPHDHYRYTPYALERLLAEAGFEDVRIQALGGWNAALAQMIGLWLRRAPMSGESREQLTRDLFPFYTELVRTDAVPPDFTKNPMVTGLSGTAKAPLARRTAGPGTGGRRVVVVTDQFPVLSQTFILDQVTGLIDRGLAVEHWSMQRMDEPVVHENVGRYGLIEKTRYISLPPESLRGSPHKWTERFLRDNGIADLDDVAAVQVHFGPNFLKLEPLFAAHPGLFAVVSFHGYDGSATFRVKGPDVYAGLFARADMITTPSGYMKDALARHGCPPDKIAVHHYGKDTTAFAPTPREKKSGPVRVLSVARFVEKKGLEYSLAAFATAQAGFDAQYRIVGYGPLEKDLAALARTLGVADKVVFLGQLTNDAVRREMAEADIFVLTSVTAANGDQEGVPVSLIEAQALGLPVVSSRHAGIPELVVHGETGFLAEERDVAEITGYLRTLIKNPSIRSAFSANARDRVLREFDLASLNDALAGYLLHRGPGRKPAARPADQGHADDTASRDEPGPDAQDTARYCPICKGRQVRFRSFGNPSRPDALCPDCTSLERHRALWVFLERHTSLFSSPRLRMLHFAPEACLENRFRQALGKGYLTADLLDPRADVRADITNLRFPEASFDAILCSHVLEHVPDDRAAMRELHRVLDADGVAIVMVPLKGETTEEDLSITDPEERTRRYGQSDHVRYYGMDIVDRLRDAGFTVTCIETADVCAPKDIERMRLGANRMFVCRKDGRRRTAGPASASGDAPSGHAGRETRARDLRATAKHWSASRAAPRTRWWMHPAILRHVNALVCGSPVEGPWAGLEQRMRELADGNGFRRGLSVGCGSASKELHLLQEGIVGHFDLFEISPERVAAGKAAAGRRGVAERAVFHVRDAFGMELDDHYDLVYWNNALHHMFDVRQALVWSRDRLRPGGWLVMDDYVGATRFQWPDIHLEIASRVRRSLPERLLRDPADPGRQCPQRVTRPTLQNMLAADPSEAADSDSILPALPQVFPGVRIIPTGGVVYNLALKDIIANFGDPDADRLRELLDYDAELAARGQTQYACAFASKQAAGQA